MNQLLTLTLTNLLNKKFFIPLIWFTETETSLTIVNCWESSVRDYIKSFCKRNNLTYSYKSETFVIS